MAKRFAFKPLGDRVLVKPDEKMGERKLASGIIIPESANKDKLMTGVVIAVGEGKKSDEGKRISLEVKVGDQVLFKKPWDEPLKINGEEYFVLSESDISLIKQ